MIERGGGRIINISSIGAYLLTSGAYAVSKFGVVGLTINLARDLAKHNITVNAIAPGTIETSAIRQLGYSFDEAFERERRQEGFVKAWGQPEDLSAALLYLVSDAGGFMTGQTLRINGGWVFQI
jgi:3-oxoacyl-[acyl-carrier protein] reductase